RRRSPSCAGPCVIRPRCCGRPACLPSGATSSRNASSPTTSTTWPPPTSPTSTPPLPSPGSSGARPKPSPICRDVVHDENRRLRARPDRPLQGGRRRPRRHLRRAPRGAVVAGGRPGVARPLPPGRRRRDSPSHGPNPGLRPSHPAGAVGGSPPGGVRRGVGAVGLLPPPARASPLGVLSALLARRLDRGLVPPRVADGAGLVEEAALGAGEWHGLIGVEPAALDHFARRQGAGGIVPAVGA